MSHSLAEMFNPTPSSSSVPSTKFIHDQKGRSSTSKSHGSFSRTRTYPTCHKCGQNHGGKYFQGRNDVLGVVRRVTTYVIVILNRVNAVVIVELSTQLQQQQQVAWLSKVTHLIQVMINVKTISILFRVTRIRLILLMYSLVRYESLILILMLC